MRRKDREVTDLGAIGRIIGDCKVLRLGMVDGRRPYVVPMNFGFDLRDGVLELYCHSALEGRKIEILRRNPNASRDGVVTAGLIALAWTTAATAGGAARLVRADA